MSSKEEAQSAIKKRSSASGEVKTKKSASEEMKFFSSESTGMQMHPKSVLLLSIIYMGVVVVLHIIGKLRQNSEKA